MNDWPIEERVGGVRLSGVASSREFVWNAEEKRCDEDGGHCVTDEAEQQKNTKFENTFMDPYASPKPRDEGGGSMGD